MSDENERLKQKLLNMFQEIYGDNAGTNYIRCLYYPIIKFLSKEGKVVARKDLEKHLSSNFGGDTLRLDHSFSHRFNNDKNYGELLKTILGFEGGETAGAEKTDYYIKDEFKDLVETVLNQFTIDDVQVKNLIDKRISTLEVKSSSNENEHTYPKVWKISHGKKVNMSDDDHVLLLQNNMVAIGFSNPENDPRGQKASFQNITEGDKFYLVRNAKIVLWGQFATNETISTPDGFSKQNWTARSITKIKEADFLVNKLKSDMRRALGWLPSGQSTVFQVPNNQSEAFESGILKPVFDLSLANDANKKYFMANTLNKILYGPPGTGKTYNTVIEAMRILEPSNVSVISTKDEFKQLKSKFNDFKMRGQVEFVTFHQSFSYEDFIEGIRTDTKDDKLVYSVVPGIFKLIADKAIKDKDNKYVLIIDEINRGNISRIFGELITLIEPSKRLGSDEEITIKLPYSKTADFGVPKNLYIIGTMNTADRSLALMDTALRRRFDFIEMMPQPELLAKIVIDGVSIESMLDIINQRIEALYDREHTIGHAFFMDLNKDSKIADLAQVFRNKILPLLEEYFFEDWEKISKVLGQSNIYIEKNFNDLVGERSRKSYEKNVEALNKADTYLNITKPS